MMLSIKKILCKPIILAIAAFVSIVHYEIFSLLMERSRFYSNAMKSWKFYGKYDDKGQKEIFAFECENGRKGKKFHSNFSSFLRKFQLLRQNPPKFYSNLSEF